MFVLTRHHGFAMKFKNGWTASVQPGPGNYCERHDARDFMAASKTERWVSLTAEVACFPPSGGLVELEGGDTRRSFLNADEVLAFLNETAAR